jgi:hypothetical protein
VRWHVPGGNLDVDNRQALAFRVAGHHLHERTEPLAAVGACGLQEHPPGWAVVALHARARGELDPDEVVTVNAMRGAAYVLPRADVAIFTAALVPDEEGLPAFVGGSTAAEVSEAGFSVREALELVEAAAREGLDAGPLDRDAFHQALRERLPDGLLPWCRGCQSHHVRPGLWRALGPLGVTQMPAKATFALADYPTLPLEEARAELVRRWLWSFGPGTRDDIKWWTGWTVAATRQALATIGAVEVSLDGGRIGYVLPDDLEPTESAEPWAALLPPLDPTTMGWQERGWYLGPYKEQLFDTAGNAGPTMWWDGRIVGGWRQGEEGEVVPQPLEDLPPRAREAFQSEAERLTEWLGGTKVLPRFPSPLLRG